MAVRALPFPDNEGEQLDRGVFRGGSALLGADMPGDARVRVAVPLRGA